MTSAPDPCPISWKWLMRHDVKLVRALLSPSAQAGRLGVLAPMAVVSGQRKEVRDAVPMLARLEQVAFLLGC
jgi:hypothetical protein